MQPGSLHFKYPDPQGRAGLSRGLLGLMLVLAGLMAGAAGLRLPDQGAFVLPAALGPSVLKQCSREAPADVSGFWTPSRSDIVELESLLPAFLEEQRASGQSTPPGTVAYHRQYVGFVRDGERFIYGNFYPDDVARTLADHTPRAGGVRFAETTDPVLVCDGGAVFWGIVFAVGPKTFEAPHFNGSV